MNWHYFKFTYQTNILQLTFWTTALLLSCFIPREFLDEENKDILNLIYFGCAVFTLSRTSMIDLLSPTTSPGKSTSMKYILSLNTTKKELFINYLLSYYMLSLPSVLAFSLAAHGFFSIENTYAFISKALLIALFVGFMAATSLFHRKFFIFKAGSFQDQFLIGQKFYKVRLFLTALFFVSVFTLGVNYFEIPSPDMLVMVWTMIFSVIAFLISLSWVYYIPVLALYIYRSFKKSIKSFNNPYFFHGKFRDHKKESRLIAVIAFSFSFFIFFEPTPQEFSGNKLTKAIYSGDFQEIKKTSISENLNKLSPSGVSPLMAAAYTGQWEVYQYLKDIGASAHPDATINNKKYTLLGASLYGGHIQIISDVVDAKLFDLNEMAPNGELPLHYVSRFCRGDIAKVLISKGALVNAQNSKGETPLHLAIKHSCNDLGLVLLSLAADPMIQDKQHKIAFDYKAPRILPYLEDQIRKPAAIEEAD